MILWLCRMEVIGNYLRMLEQKHQWRDRIGECVEARTMVVVYDS